MPYNYTPTPVYTVPVQLASDGDPASSATIMGPIEAALDNIAEIWEHGPRTIRHVDDLAALKALTGMAHNEVALVASAEGAGFPGASLGLWRYILGGSVDFPSLWAVDANDASGSWVWVDYSRVGTSGGLPVLQSARRFVVAPGATYATSSDSVRIANGGYAEVIDSGELRVENDGELIIAKTGTGVSDGGTMAVYVGGGAFDSAKGVHVASGGGAHVDSGGLLAVHAGGTLRLEGTTTATTGSVTTCESGSTTTFSAGSTANLNGSVYLGPGSVTLVQGPVYVGDGTGPDGYIQLINRLRHTVFLYVDADLNGSPYSIGPETADEHIFGASPAALTTFTLTDPEAEGQRVRFSRTSIAVGATHVQVVASGTTYVFGSTNGDLRWLELTAALSGSTLTWFPSAYAVH